MKKLKTLVRYAGEGVTEVNEGIKSIVNGDICVIIMVGEHGEQSIQTNLESYNNLDNILNEFEKRKSTIFLNKDNDSKIEEVKEIKAKEIFVNKKSLEEKKKKDKIFINNIKHKVDESDFLDTNKANDLESKELLFENALKEEKKSRKNPLKLLEVFIKRIQRLCNKLLEVRT